MKRFCLIQFDMSTWTRVVNTILLFTLLFAPTAFAGMAINDFAFPVGSTDRDEGLSVALGANGDVFIGGYFTGSVDFDPGPDDDSLIPVNPNASNGFIQKLDANGTYEWVKYFTGIGSVGVLDLTTDNAGNIYASGSSFSAGTDLDPGDGELLTESPGVFIVKLGPNGDLIWAKSIETGLHPYGFSIALDTSNNVYVTGHFTDSADFDPGPGVETVRADEQDIFVLKLDSLGNYVWAKTMRGNYAEASGRDIAIDLNGDVCITGYIEGSADFDPGPEEHLKSSVGEAGYGDQFTLKLDSQGNFSWVTAVAAITTDFSFNCITLDANNNIYTMGTFSDTVDFNTGPFSTELTSMGEADLYISCSNSDGQFQWVTAMGSAHVYVGSGIAMNDAGKIYTTGWFANNNPDTPNDDLPYSDDADIFVAAFNPPFPIDSPIPPSCGYQHGLPNSTTHSDSIILFIIMGLLMVRRLRENPRW